MGVRERQRAVQLYRGQIPSPGAPTVAWREDRMRFWAAIAGGAKTDDAAVEAGVSSPVAYRWFRHAGGVNPCLPPAVSGRYLSFPSGRTSPFGVARRSVSARSLVGSGGTRRRSRVRCAAMHQLGRGDSSTRLRPRSGTRSGEPGGPRRPSWSSTSGCAITSRTAFRVWSRRPMAELWARAPQWKGRNKPHRGDRRWVEAWSPEQISQRLPVDFPDDESMRVSHEAIYQALYVQGRGALKRELVACLRTGRALRVPRSRSRQKAWAHVTPEVMISERPA